MSCRRGDTSPAQFSNMANSEVRKEWAQPVVPIVLMLLISDLALWLPSVFG